MSSLVNLKSHFGIFFCQGLFKCYIKENDMNGAIWGSENVFYMEILIDTVSDTCRKLYCTSSCSLFLTNIVHWRWRCVYMSECVFNLRWYSMNADYILYYLEVALKVTLTRVGPFKPQWLVYVPWSWTLKKNLRFALWFHLCVLFGSQSK